jgi:methionine-gamma-lyase
MTDWKDEEAHIKGRKVRPESLMMGYGYRPEDARGALKCPVFPTSTFVFQSAEEGKAFFELLLGERELGPEEEPGMIYSRFDNPDLAILEDRLRLWDEAEACVVFSAGMAAIATTVLALVDPGQAVLFSEPLYGGTDHLFKNVVTRLGYETVGFPAGEGPEAIEEALERSGLADRLAMVLVETPANPSNALVDIGHCAEVARKHSSPDRRVLVAVDNTFLGPIFQHPLEHGADMVIYSCTKYIGGHSDLIGGATLGPADQIGQVRAMRSVIGTMPDPYTAWMLLRSLETLKLRMTRQVDNAARSRLPSGAPEGGEDLLPGPHLGGAP